jgi:hypothetical protein
MMADRPAAVGRRHVLLRRRPGSANGGGNCFFGSQPRPSVSRSRNLVPDVDSYKILRRSSEFSEWMQSGFTFIGTYSRGKG